MRHRKFKLYEVGLSNIPMISSSKYSYRRTGLAGRMCCYLEAQQLRSRSSYWLLLLRLEEPDDNKVRDG